MTLTGDSDVSMTLLLASLVGGHALVEAGVGPTHVVDLQLVGAARVPRQRDSVVLCQRHVVLETGGRAAPGQVRVRVERWPQ